MFPANFLLNPFKSIDVSNYVASASMGREVATEELSRAAVDDERVALAPVTARGSPRLELMFDAVPESVDRASEEGAAVSRQFECVESAEVSGVR